MTPSEIRDSMREAGITQSGVARELGVSVSSVHNVVNGTSTSYKIQSYIADQIGVEIYEIWPKYSVSPGAPIKKGHPLTSGVAVS